jgi:NADH:ubiquinone oxidoreductase subunit E
MIDADWIPTQKPLFNVRICINKRLNTDRLPSCAGRGSRGLADNLEQRVLAEGLPAAILRGPCMNNCVNGPNLKIQGAQFFNLKDDISDANIEKILAAIRAEVDRRNAGTATSDSSDQLLP